MAIKFLNTVQVDTDVLYVDAANNKVGIGTSSPNAKLSVKSSGTNSWVFRATASDGGDLGGIYEDGGTNAELYIKDSAGTSSVLINSSGDSYFNGGDVGIGTTSPSTKLHVVGTLRAGGSSDYIELNSNGNIKMSDSSAGIIPATYNTQTLSIGATMTGYWNTIIHHFGNEVVWIPGILGAMDGMNLSNAGDLLIKGDVGIGTTAPLEKLQVAGNAAIYGAIKGYTGSSSNQYLSILQSSSLTYISTGTTNETIYFGTGPVANTTNINCTGTATATNFILSSDERLKKNIKDLKPKKLNVKWKSFELKLEPDYKRVGVIAQELEKTNPEFVREDVDGTKSVAYIDLLITKIVELEARLEKAGL